MSRYEAQRQDYPVICIHDNVRCCHAARDEYGTYWHVVPAWHVWDTVANDYATGTGPAQYDRATKARKAARDLNSKEK